MAAKTIKQLRKELQTQEKKLTKLRSQRKILAGRIEAVDNKIADILGQATQTAGKKRKKAVKKVAKKKVAKKAAKKATKKNTGTKPLIAYIADALADKKSGMRAGQVAQAVTKAGYKSISKNFSGIISATLRDKKFKRVKHGVYTLA